MRIMKLLRPAVSATSTGRRALRVRSASALIVVFATLPLTLFPVAVFAESADGVLPPESAQGWFWDRPATAPPSGLEVIGDPIGQQIAPGQFAANHLYVGWDAADVDDKREMIAGVGFDLFTAGVPTESTITKFVVTLIEHSTGHNTVNAGEAKNQGVVACPWPSFYGGSVAAPMANAPDQGGNCKETKVVGAPGNQAVAPYPGDTPDRFVWTFDLTDLMNTLWQNAENTAFSLEPNPDKPSSLTWITSFHSGAYGEPKEIQDPFGEQVGKPGLLASVSWVPREPIGGDLDSSLGELEVTDEAGSLDFGGGNGTQDSGDAQTGAPVQLSAQPSSAGLPGSSGQMPLLAWIGGLFTLVFLGLSGWLLNLEPASQRREPGAVWALIHGGGLSDRLSRRSEGNAE